MYLLSLSLHLIRLTLCFRTFVHAVSSISNAFPFPPHQVNFFHLLRETLLDCLVSFLIAVLYSLELTITVILFLCGYLIVA